MNYLKQIYFEMRHYKMMTWVSISGTALAIFLVMTFIMATRIETVEVKPESNRSRILVAKNLHAEYLDGKGDMSASGLGPESIRKFYEDLDGVEVISYINAWDNTVDANLKGEESITCAELSVDENFWKVYDFHFVDGRPFDEAERKADMKEAVITTGTARKLFGEEKVAGREIEINMMPYTVVGVVEDGSPILSSSYAKIYRIFNIDSAEPNQNVNWFGNVNARLLLKEGTDPQDVKRQVEERYRLAAADAARDGIRIIYHDQPYTAEDLAAGTMGSNNSPDTKRQRNIHYFIYAILILLPAINLSSMTRSRLRHRVAEIGVRRAFGAKRINIVTQLFGENLIITLIGGIIGLALSLVFILFASTFLFNFSNSLESSLELIDATPDLEMVFQWSTFFIALFICLILNILSATVPAWRASLTEPAVALSSK